MEKNTLRDTIISTSSSGSISSSSGNINSSSDSINIINGSGNVLKANEEPCDADVKIIILGDSAVGKSKLVERFLMDKFNPRQISTYALTLYRYNAVVDDKPYAVDIWDTAGQEQFDNLHPSYFYGADACIMVFDISRKITYKHLERWYQELRQYCLSIPCLLVANKIDCDMSVVSKEFNFAKSHQIPLYYVSAANGTNVVQIFEKAIHLAIRNKLNPDDTIMAEIMALIKDD